MKIKPLLSDNIPKRMKMIITESQLKALAQNVINEQEKETIKKTYLENRNTNGKKK
jgi:hypothetical protein